MEIKENIGNRITQSRKQLGITIKELATRTKKFSAARVGNWEQGTRNPGPSEAKILSNILGVSPSYLLCLSDDPRGDLHLQSDFLPRYVPLIPMNKINMKKSQLQELIENMPPYSRDEEKVSLDKKICVIAGENTFATTIEDSSMGPEFKPGDIVVIDADVKPHPGQVVAAHIKQTNENIIRKYRQTSASTTGASYELIVSNADWGSLQISKPADAIILGVVIEHRRYKI